MSSSKIRLELPEIGQRLRAAALPEVDLVVGVGTGGVALATMAAFWLEKPLKIMQINYRAPDNRPQRTAPELLEPFDAGDAARVLVVDDVSVSGATLALAKQLLRNRQVTSLTLKGPADVSLFPEAGSCLLLPWRDL